MILVLMHVVGAVLLVMSALEWLCALVPSLRGRAKWGAGRGGVVPVGVLSEAGFGLMFGGLGAAFFFGDWLIPEESMAWFLIPVVAGLAMIFLCGYLDRKAFERTRAAGGEMRTNNE